MKTRFISQARTAGLRPSKFAAALIVKARGRTRANSIGRTSSEDYGAPIEPMALFLPSKKAALLSMVSTMHSRIG